MELKKNSEAYSKVYDTLQEIKKNLIELSKQDLTNIHVGQEWSWIPYTNEHIAFLVEQVNGLAVNLRDEPPPVLPEELDILRGSSNPNLK